MGRTSAAGRDRDRIPGVAEEPDPPFPVLLRACAASAVHLEMRDAYTPADPWFQAWLAGDRGEFERRMNRPWLDLIREVTGRGEQVRWLPRHLATGLLLPTNDYWVFDGRRAQFNYFSGPGEFLSTRLCDDPAISAHCAAAFDAVWERAVPHEEY